MACRSKLCNTFCANSRPTGWQFEERELLQELSRADDLDRKWKVAEVLNALLLMTTTRTALKWWLSKEAKPGQRQFEGIYGLGNLPKSPCEIGVFDYATAGYALCWGEGLLVGGEAVDNGTWVKGVMRNGGGGW